MDLKLLKMLCKDSKQHHVIFHEFYSVSLRLCIAQNVRFEIPYKVLYFETPCLIIFKCYAWVSCGLGEFMPASNLASTFFLVLIEEKSTPLNFLYFSTQLSLKILVKQSKTAKKMLAFYC